VPEEFGPYLVYEQLGLGGMATVHRAEQHGVHGFRKAVALKRMLPSVAADGSLVQSFIREARLASHLRHVNVAQTYDLGKVGDTYFIAMELVPGRNLREILKQSALVTGPMPLPLALNILNQLCDALDYAHNLCDEMGQPLGIIHRDVSPANIIVSEGGVVKLIDFGIAKASAQGMQTMSGTLKGKFGYMAPEYIGGKIDSRVDLFAIGVIAHELLTGKPLFTAKDDMGTLMNVKEMPIKPPSALRRDVPPEIDTIVLTALARDPDQRWQRANALRTALTHEAMRLGLVALNQQVIDWVDWAFTQTKKRNDDSDPVIQVSRAAMAAGSVPEASDSMPTMIRPSGPLPPLRGSAPQPAQRMSGSMPTQMGMGAPPPISPAASGARTGQLQQVSGSQILAEHELSGVLAGLGETGVSMTTRVREGGKRKSTGRIWFALLVLLVAAGTAAAVYFALPYFT
jgi:serine/threonine protein kinase